MFDVFLAELLVISLLIILSLRIFFTKHARIDSLAVLASVALVFSLLIFFIWGASQFIPAILLLAFLSFLLNLRSLVRLSNRLVVDFYNLRFAIPTLLMLLASIGLLVLTIIFHPVKYKIKDFNVQRTTTSLTGKLNSGISVRQTMLERSRITGMLYTYAPLSTQEEPSPILIFVPKCSASVENYEPYFLMLAQKGYTVLSAEFNTPDRTTYDIPVLNTRYFRRFYTLCLYFFDNAAYFDALKTDTEYVLKGYAALANIAKKQYGEDTSLFFIVEEIGIDALREMAEPFAKNSLGFFALNRIDEYKTPNFGFLEQTDALESYVMGLKRDDSFFIPRYAAGKTDIAIRQAQKLQVPVQIIKANAENEQEAQK